MDTVGRTGSGSSPAARWGREGSASRLRDAPFFRLPDLFTPQHHPEIPADSLQILSESVAIRPPDLIRKDGGMQVDPGHPAEDERQFLFHLEPDCKCVSGYLCRSGNLRPSA